MLSLNVNEAYVNKSDTFIDEDNLQWHSVDILLTYTNNYSTMWEESNFRIIFFKNVIYGIHTVTILEKFQTCRKKKESRELS